MIEMDVSAAEALSRCIRGIEDILGGTVTERCAGERVEASFGLLHSERLRCCVEPLLGNGSRVRIDSRALVGETPRARSVYVDRLAAYLEEDG